MKLFMKRIVIYIILFCSMLGLYTTYTINDFRMIDIKKIETLDEPGIKYVYFGRNTCSLCNEFENNIDQYKDILPNTLFYFNTDYWREVDNEILIEICSKYRVEIIPKIIIIKDGEYNGEIDIEKMMIEIK